MTNLSTNSNSIEIERRVSCAVEQAASEDDIHKELLEIFLETCLVDNSVSVEDSHVSVVVCDCASTHSADINSTGTIK